MTPESPLGEEELALWDGGLVPGVSLSRMSSAATIATVRRLIAALRASRSELAALSWATKEYDEDTGYCLCGCCRHGV